MLDISNISRNYPHASTFNPPNRSEGKLYQLRKSKLGVLSEYERTLISFTEEERQIRKLNSNVDDAINKLKNEKAQLEKILQDALLQQEKATWDKISLEKTLKQQQEQISIYQDQKEQHEESQNMLRRESLLHLKERDATIQAKQSAQSTQLSTSHQCRALEEQIVKLKAANQTKSARNNERSLHLQEIEQGSIKILQQINHLDEQIETNTLTIEKKLTLQSHLANRYGQLKRMKKQLQEKINKVNDQIKEQKNITSEFMEVEMSLNEALSQIRKDLQAESSQIHKLKTQNGNQRQDIATNKECLAKLRIYLDNLKNQSNRIELYMERVLEEDFKIKAVLDRKHSRPNSRPKKWLNEEREDKSMSSTFA